MSNVFIVINEWSTDKGSSFSELVDGIYWATEGRAWEYLHGLAAAHGHELPKDEFSFSPSTPSQGITYEEYYIQELTPA